MKAETVLLAAAALDSQYVAGQRKNTHDNATTRVECALELLKELEKQAPHLFSAAPADAKG